MQANGAEMLRLACCLATERGIRVCAPVHDAVLIEAPADQLEAHVEATQRAMAEASSIVLGGFALRSDAKVVPYPERYRDERGTQMWRTVWDVLSEI
jgi:DNA polymerase-1